MAGPIMGAGFTVRAFNHTWQWLLLLLLSHVAFSRLLFFPGLLWALGGSGRCARGHLIIGLDNARRSIAPHTLAVIGRLKARSHVQKVESGRRALAAPLPFCVVEGVWRPVRTRVIWPGGQ